jgi:hypothetical protein
MQLEINESLLTTTENCCDVVGRVFFYKNRVLRGINKEYIDQIKFMFESGLMSELIDNKLIPNMWISKSTIFGYDLVVEVEYISSWSYAYEWPFSMLKEAALMVIKINNILNKYGFEIIDPHQDNITYMQNFPVYIDVGSFRRVKSKSWLGYEGLNLTLYTPLWLMSKSLDTFARGILRLEYSIEDSEGLLIKHPLLLNIKFLFNFITKIRFYLFKLANYDDKNSRLKKYKNFIFIFSILAIKIKGAMQYALSRNIKKIAQPIPATIWANYQDRMTASEEERFEKIKNQIISLTDAKSMVEVASNQGKFAAYILDNTQISSVIATDRDVNAVNKMFLANRCRTNFLSLIYDFTSPSAAGSRLRFSDRMKSDLVVALAVTHHLILSNNMDLDYIFKSLLCLTRKYIIVEFMPLGLYVDGLVKNVPYYYNQEWFENSLSKYFEIISSDNLEINRISYTAKIRKNND